MDRRLILVGYSSNSAGGRTGLISLLEALPADRPAIVLVDERMELPFALPGHVRVERVARSISGRLKAELLIERLATADSWILRLGSVPPFFPSSAPVFVFFENRHLTPGASLAGMSLKTRLRVHAERLMVRLFRRRAMFLVQSESMADGLRRLLGRDVRVAVMPLHARLAGSPDAATNGAESENIDFIFPSTGDPHKNHRTLVLAWARLAQEGIRPSLVVTVDPATYPDLASWIAGETQRHELRIRNIGFVPPHDLPRYYRRARALIFPSTCESFGRPLLEARDFDLPILAGELDYVRDVVDPVQSFDPASPISIARAVKRFLGVDEPRNSVCEARTFLAELQRHANEGRGR